MSAAVWDEPPANGTLVHDGERVAVVMEASESIVYLRPLKGGLEARVPLASVRPLTPEEALSAKVAEANRQSQNKLYGQGAA